MGKLDPFGIDHDELELGGIVPVEQGEDHGVEPYALSRSGCACDEQVRHLREVRHHGHALDIGAQGKGERGVGHYEFAAGEDLLQIYHLAGSVGDLDAHRVLARYGRNDPDRRGLERHGEIVCERHDLVDFDARCRRELVHGDDRAGFDLQDLAFNPEVLELRYDERRVCLELFFRDDTVFRRRIAEQGEGRALIVAHEVKCGLLRKLDNRLVLMPGNGDLRFLFRGRTLHAGMSGVLALFRILSGRFLPGRLFHLPALAPELTVLAYGGCEVLHRMVRGEDIVSHHHARAQQHEEQHHRSP